MKQRIVWWMKALCAGVLICFLLSLCGFEGACEDIGDRVLRLHIIAHSDSAEDQQMKLKVRDELTKTTDRLFGSCQSKEEASALCRDCLPELQEAAEECLRQNGCDLPVTVRLAEIPFDTRVYEEFSLPAGTYEALQVTIGEGKGHNWWCVLYPAVCVAASGEDIGSALTPQETDIVQNSGRYQIGFRCVEWFQSLHQRRRWTP